MTWDAFWWGWLALLAVALVCEVAKAKVPRWHPIDEYDLEKGDEVLIAIPMPNGPPEYAVAYLGESHIIDGVVKDRWLSSGGTMHGEPTHFMHLDDLPKLPAPRRI